MGVRVLGAMREAGKSTEVRVGFRRGWFQYIEVALGGAGLVAVMLAALKLIETQPGGAFNVLTAWGPWPFVALCFLGLLGHFLNRLSDTIHSAFAQVIESSQQATRAVTMGAEAQQRMAEAIGQIAQKDDRQLQEIQTLAAYTAQQSERMHHRQKSTDRVLALIAAQLNVSEQEIARAKGDHDG